MNKSRDGVVRVAALGDLHMKEDGRGSLREIFAHMSDAADVAALCGDLTDLGLPTEAENLAADLSALRIPAVAVLGNHDYQNDKAGEIKKILRGAGLHFLEDHSFVTDGVGFAGTKGFAGGFGRHTQNSFGELVMKQFVQEALNEALFLENSLHYVGEKKKLMVVLHYSPIRETLVGEPEEVLPFLGNSRMADVIDKFPVGAVVHGHAHHGVHKGQTKGKIPVYNCAWKVLQKDLKRPFAVIEL